VLAKTDYVGKWTVNYFPQTDGYTTVSIRDPEGSLLDDRQLHNLAKQLRGLKGIETIVVERPGLVIKMRPGHDHRLQEHIAGLIDSIEARPLATVLQLVRPEKPKRSS
jgi:hypothetical protein